MWVGVSRIPSPKPQSRSETVEKWEHDLYIEEEQKPRTQSEKERVSRAERDFLCSVDHDRLCFFFLGAGSQAFGGVGVSLVAETLLV